MFSYKKCKDLAEVFSYFMLGISFIGKESIGDYYQIILAFAVSVIAFCIITMVFDKS
jgi:hypothetical protein